MAEVRGEDVADLANSISVSAEKIFGSFAS
jgi:hypothetical protein